MLEYNEDPYLMYRPDFARSLPIQILMTGIVLTLVGVLLIHLLFTAQYHWPLAPVNYVLQVSGVVTLLISLIATLHIVLSAALKESKQWPYMLSYIAVNVPPVDTEETDEYNVEFDWNLAERATWAIMSATMSGLIQITHIQFLTLLYPSRLERRLIFSLLGPLAIVAAAMQLVVLSDNTNVNWIAYAIRNVCNASLSLLFTAGVFIWGLLVNRKEAWRTDGGTAIFGAGALILALASTALNFLFIPRQEETVWLPSLIWAVILWQSFLGWWWWVGAGSGSRMSAAADDDEQWKLENRKRKRRRAVERELATREREQRRGATSDGNDNTVSGPSGRRIRIRGVLSSAMLRHTARSKSRSISRERGRGRPEHPSRSASPTSPTARSRSPSRSRPTNTNSRGETGQSSSDTSNTSTGTLPRILPDVFHRWYARLAQAHVTAARRQAVERSQRIRELDRATRPTSSRRRGWGLGSFALRARSFDRHLEEGRTGEIELQERRRGEDRHDGSDLSGGEGDTGDPSAATTTHPSGDDPRIDAPHSVWWLGPLRQWRLQDRTVY